MTSFQKAHERIRTWREEPLRFSNEVFGLTLDEWQKEGLSHCGGAPNPRRRIGFKACTGPGKTLELAVMGWHRLACFGGRGEHPKGAALSGQGRDNLRDNLWSELSKLRERSPFLKAAFEMNQERIYAKDHADTWFLSARSYPKDANPEAVGQSLSGLHSPYPFLLLDECGDMPATVGQKATQIFTGDPKDALIAAAGNPTSTTGLLYELATKQRHLWNVITITADPDDPKRTPRVSVEHAREQIALHGRDNPWVMATILGLFPLQGFNVLLSIDAVEKAMARRLREDAYTFSQKRLGVDVARFGDDRTVLFPRQGLRSFKCVEMRGARNPDISARILTAKRNWQYEMEFVDDTGGFGGGVIDLLLQAGSRPTAVNFSESAIDPRYYNKRAEMWFELAEWVKRGGWLPNDPQLARELTAPTYTFKDGKLILESKDQIKKRLGFSPDKADALALTFALPDMPGANSNDAVIAALQAHQPKEYDPHHDA